jgi:metalloprotein, YbeY/UPF0054 family
MPVNLQCDESPLQVAEVERLWEEARQYRNFSDEQVNIRCVSAEEMRTLNGQYRGQDKATNVLTFSYPEEHDVALCLEVGRKEAAERGMSLRDYTALLLTHAFLHAAGLDHERSEREAEETKTAERIILERAGFSALSL